MPGLEIGVLATATAKLVAIGVDAWTADKRHGWGVDEVKAFGSALASVPAFEPLLRRRPTDLGPLQSYCELVTVAFGEAWRRHWVYNARLAPSTPKSRWQRWFRSASERARLAQVEACLRAGHFEKSLGDTPEADVALLISLDDALTSVWYRALWSAFHEAERDADSAEMPPLLVLGARARQEFEWHYLIAFSEGLVSTRGAPLRAWLQQQSKDRSLLLRQLLAARVSRFRSEEIFANGGVNGAVPQPPLEALYVEPAGRVRGDPKVQGPVLGVLHTLLDRPETGIIVVLADFGRGKSLTARTLAYTLAERFLTDHGSPSPELAYPIFVCCQESFRRRNLDAESAVRLAQKRAAESFLPSADPGDEAFGIPQHQKVVVIFDGLDEVQLSGTEAKDFFEDLEARANRERRFVVFSRPAAVPRDVQRADTVTVVEIEDFSLPPANMAATPGAAPSHVELWLERWSEHVPPPHPDVAELRKRGLLELCVTPVLLFMIAQTWHSLRAQERIQSADVYDAFILLMARSKLEHARQHAHPIVAEAAGSLRERLVTTQWLPPNALAEHAMIELLSRIAWRAQQLADETDIDRRPLTSLEVKNLLSELGLSPNAAELVERGVLLALSTSLGDGDAEVNFTHRSFQDFLVAKYWEARLERLANASRSKVEQLEAGLYGGRLMNSPASFHFLVELCSRWSPELLRKVLTWAEDTFQDDRLSAETLLNDRRYALREAALAIGSTLGDTGLRAENPRTLATLLASFFCRSCDARIVAKGLVHPEAKLGRAALSGAVLAGANLRGANLGDALLDDAVLNGADLAHVDLTNASLDDADLRGANLRDADLTGATLQGADLSGADLSGANLMVADLSGALLTGADFTGTMLGSAVLRGADLRGAGLVYESLQGAHWDDETRFPPGFLP